MIGTYSQESADAREGAAFANGYEYDCWASRWCDNCVYGEKLCPLMDVAAIDGATPAKWLDWVEDGLSDRYICTEYVGPPNR